MEYTVAKEMNTVAWRLNKRTKVGRSTSETKVSMVKYIGDYSSLKLLRIGGDLEKSCKNIWRAENGLHKDLVYGNTGTIWWVSFF